MSAFLIRRFLPLLLLTGTMGCGGLLDVKDESPPIEESPRDPLPTDDTLDLPQNTDGEGEESPQEDGEEDDPPGDGPGETEDEPEDNGEDVEPEPEPEDAPPEEANPPSCDQWQDCGPHFDDLNSGFECVENACTCDPVGQWSSTCSQNGGYFIQQECFCAFADAAPPDYGNENCYWSWEQGPCDPDRWVDTSHYEEECGYNAYDEWECNSVWIESGYWEAGDCPAGYWLERC